jgi:molybdopterin converting factor small subunit
MSVSVRIPTILRNYTDGASEVTAEGATVSEVLDDLEANHSGIKGRVLDDAGRDPAFRERLRRQRRRPVPRVAGDADSSGRADQHHPGRGRGWFLSSERAKRVEGC